MISNRLLQLTIFCGLSEVAAVRKLAQVETQKECLGQPPPGYPTCFPSTSSEAAATLNRMYMGYDRNDPTSPLGVTISMAGQPQSFSKNLFCHAHTNSNCINGFTADCRMSAAVYNHKMLLEVDATTNETMKKIRVMGGRQTGYVFNQHFIQGRIGKCAYVFDGATNNNMNGGCGKLGSALCPGGYDGKCPSSMKICTTTDPEVTQMMCKTKTQPAGGTPPPESGVSLQCFFELPALGWPAVNGSDHLREMIDYRMSVQSGWDPVGGHGPKVKQWNEIVIDERELIPLLHEDAANAIWAFVYKFGNVGARQMALRMRDEFCETFKCSRKPPLVAFDTGNDFSNNCGPFHKEEHATEDSVERCTKDQVSATKGEPAPPPAPPPASVPEPEPEPVLEPEPEPVPTPEPTPEPKVERTKATVDKNSCKQMHTKLLVGILSFCMYFL